MRRRLSALAAAAMLMMTAAAGCGDKKNYSTSGTSSGGAMSASSANDANDLLTPTDPFEGVPQVNSGPQLYFNDTKAKAGEYAEVSLCVKNANENWNMCGIHVTYPEALYPKMISDEADDVEVTLGEASANSSGHVCLRWTDNLDQPLEEAGLGCIFFTEMFMGDFGGDGEIFSFLLKIPDDAPSGTTYTVGTYYKENDIFINSAEDKSMERFAFEHAKTGTITVE